MLDDSQQSIENARAAGVSSIVAVGIDLKGSRAAINHASDYAEVAATVGVHPHDTAAFGKAELDELRQLAGRDEVVAIGETGLDYYRNRSPRDAQQRAFISQIELARDVDKALIVHSRDSAEETLELLRAHAGGLTVILHCFSLVELVRECAESGYYMSMAGNVTFKNAGALRQAAADIPERLLLTETDSPFLAPEPHRGMENQPANVGLVLERLASIRQVPSGRLAEQVAANYSRAFSLPRH